MPEIEPAMNKMSGIEAVIEEIFPDLILMGRLDKGWSSDSKFILGSEDEGKYLLRVSESVNLERRYETARMMKLALSAGISAPQPITCGKFPSGATYILQTWLEGSPLDELLTGYSEKNQYLLGRKAGRILASLTEAQTDVESPDFGMRKLRKLKNKLTVYSSCEALVPRADEALRYIHDNVDLIHKRPSLPLHGDFHPGNMLLHDGFELSLIDFDRCDFGDPYEEFYKAQMFARPLSEAFINGQIHAYFNDRVPAEFWGLFKFYLAEAVFYSPVWALPFGREQVSHLAALSRMATDDFDAFSLQTPIWYRKPEDF